MVRQSTCTAPITGLKSAQALKVELAARIISALERRGLTVREAQAITGHAAADFSRLRSGDLARFTVERLLGMAERLGAFGSVLREDFDPSRSDIDLAVEFARSQLYGPADQYFKFKEALEQLLGLEVDLVELRALERVPRFLAERTLQVYLHDEFCQSAVERQLEIAGDALGQIRKLSPELFA